MGTESSKHGGAKGGAAGGGASHTVPVSPSQGTAAAGGVPVNSPPQSPSPLQATLSPSSVHHAAGSSMSSTSTGSTSSATSASVGVTPAAQPAPAGAAGQTPAKTLKPTAVQQAAEADKNRKTNHSSGNASSVPSPTNNASSAANAPPPGSNTVASAASSAPPPSPTSAQHAAQHSGGGTPSKPADAAAQHGAVFNNKLTVDDFELLKVVGKGSFGKVMQVRKKDTNAIYAMKVLKKQTLVARKQVAHTQTERRVLEEIDHPFIVSLRFAFQTTDKLYMILDYFTGGELFFHLKQTGKFSEDRAQYYAAEITCALECLHRHTVVYRDLKPENVLLDEDGHIKLTDFGLSKASVTGQALTHTFCGTPEYLAPEVIEGKPYGQAVDWWSLGTLLYEMLTGLPPYYSDNLHQMYEKILREKLTFPAYMSAEAKSFLSRLLDRNPKTRLGGGESDAEEVKKHPFFANIDFSKLVRRELKPPFKPTTSGDGKEDTTNIEDEFKNETPKDTPVMASTLRSKLHFSDFTFEGRDQSALTVAPTPNTSTGTLG